MNVWELVKKSFNQVQDHSFPELLETHHLYRDFQMDSLDSVEFIMSLEEDFGVEISDEEFDTIETLGDVKKLMERKVNE